MTDLATVELLFWIQPPLFQQSASLWRTSSEPLTQLAASLSLGWLFLPLLTPVLLILKLTLLFLLPIPLFLQLFPLFLLLFCKLLPVLFKFFIPFFLFELPLFLVIVTSVELTILWPDPLENPSIDWSWQDCPRRVWPNFLTGAQKRQYLAFT